MIPSDVKDKIHIKEIVRSKRRTLALVITQEASLVVRAPLYMPIRYIEKFVNQKKDWIRRKAAEIVNRPRQVSKKFVDGEQFLYMGSSYPFKITEGPDITLSDSLEFPQSFLPRVKEHLFEWYRAKSFEVISERVGFYSDLMGINRPPFKVTRAQKRWGSCQHNNTITFSWRLVMAPLEVIDYVVVHELAHTKQKNHSKNFWDIVKAIFPYHKKSKKWLSDNEYLLCL